MHLIDEEESEQQVCPCGDESHAPPAVLDAIAVSCRDTDAFQRKLLGLRHHAFDNMWSFDWAGMFVGVERDGHMHT